MRSRGLVAAVAIAMALVATTAVFLYIQGLEREATTGGETVTVLIAQEDIAAGTDLDDVIAEGAFTNRRIPQEDVVIGAVDELSDLANKKTSSPILTGEQVSTARLQGSKDLPGGVLGIPAGHEGLTLGIDVPRVVANAIQPGDHVKVYATLDVKDTNSSKTITFTTNLVHDATVLDFTDSPTAAEAEGSALPLVTMALTPKEAQEVVMSIERGTVWLSLLAPGEVGKKTKPITARDIAGRRIMRRFALDTP